MLYLSVECRAVHRRHLKITEDQVVGMRRQLAKGFFAVCGVVRDVADSPYYVDDQFEKD